MSSDDVPVFHLKPSLIDLVKRGEAAPVIHYLEKNPEEINQSDDHGFFPIHHAIQEKQAELIVILLEYGASLGQMAPQNVSPFMLAALHGMSAHLDLSFIDESRLFQVDDGGNSLCHYLAFNGDTEQWKLFDIPVKEIIRQNNSGKSPLQLMIEEENSALFSVTLNEALVQKELNVSVNKFLNVCIRSGSSNVLSALLSFGGQSDERWNELIEQCCVLEKPTCLSLLLDHGKEQKMQIDSNRLKAVPSGLITPEIDTILNSYL